jgi:hypothetical protein
MRLDGVRSELCSQPPWTSDDCDGGKLCWIEARSSVKKYRFGASGPTGIDDM